MKIKIKLNKQAIRKIEQAARKAAVETMEEVHSEINNTVPLDQGDLMKGIFVSDESDDNVIHVKLEHSVIYSRYLYEGLKMADKETGKGPALVRDKYGAIVGYRFRKGAKLKVKQPKEKLTFQNGRKDHWLEPYISGNKKNFIKDTYEKNLKGKI